MAPFRAAQILEWVYVRGASDPGAMSNLSKRDRDVLLREITFLSGQTISHQSASDGTQKLLIQWNDASSQAPRSPTPTAPATAPATANAADPNSSAAVIPGDDPSGLHSRLRVLNEPRLSEDQRSLDSSRQTECVMIPASESTSDEGEHSRERRTACISSQVGCPVGCKFCASGIGGLDGNLSAGRIIEQVWRLARLQGVDRISNVVFMGMGEPLSNFSAVTRAVRTLTAPWGMGIGARKITISTVGLPKAIERLADEFDLPITLALSLHAPNDAVRRELIPWAEYTSIPDLLSACRKWFDKTGREITLEYILLRGVNDRVEHAAQLADLARSLRANVNLIRYNEVKGVPFNRPSEEDVRAFQSTLREAHVNAHIRASRGRDIAAACGQLRHDQTRVVVA